MILINLGRFSLAFVSVAFLSTPAQASQPTAGRCDNLHKLAIPTVRIEAAALVDGAFTPPKGDVLIGLRSFCRVVGSAHPSPNSKIQFEVWLPSDNWNGKYLQVGNGGFAGAVPHAAMANGLRQSYAVAGTDDGTAPAGDPSFLRDADRVQDWGNRAPHSTAIAAKKVIEAFYGQPAERAYFQGCSKGGQEAMILAQRYPDDFDGLIGGNPVFDWTRAMAQWIWNAKSYSVLSAPEHATLHAHILKTCGRSTGDVIDGVIMNPSVCKPELDVLACADGKTEGCLSKNAIEAVMRIYAGPTNPRTRERIYPGMPYGSEGTPEDMGAYGWRGTAARVTSLAQPFFGVGLFDDASRNWRNFDFDRDLDNALKKYAPANEATSTDLSKFKARGGKLILYNGVDDPLYSVDHVVDWYRALAKQAGSIANAQEYVRLFLAPGMGHCGGGPGPNVVDPLPLLAAWVERGEAPASMPATKFKDNDIGKGIAATRPLCAWPQAARYRGAGSMQEARNFQCTTP